jgi:hypothetical protein
MGAAGDGAWIRPRCAGGGARSQPPILRCLVQRAEPPTSTRHQARASHPCFRARGGDRPADQAWRASPPPLPPQARRGRRPAPVDGGGRQGHARPRGSHARRSLVRQLDECVLRIISLSLPPRSARGHVSLRCPRPALRISSHGVAGARGRGSDRGGPARARRLEASVADVVETVLSIRRAKPCGRGSRAPPIPIPRARPLQFADQSGTFCCETARATRRHQARRVMTLWYHVIMEVFGGYFHVITYRIIMRRPRLTIRPAVGGCAAEAGARPPSCRYADLAERRAIKSKGLWRPMPRL